MKRLVPLVMALFLASSVSPVLATNHKHKGTKHKIAKREWNDQVRINRGVKSGQLTGKERTRLQNQQSMIWAEREQAAADGKITKGERTDIRHDQERLRQDIHQKKHNKRQVYQ